jgi:very-short-patch-repair endonuclease
VLSHRSAAALWDLLVTGGSLVDISAPRSCTRRPGIAIHRAKLHPEDRASHDGIPVTSVARTLTDLAKLVTRRQLERAVERAELLGRFDLAAVDRLIARNPRRPGLPLFRSVLGAYREPALTRSELERRFLELCRRAKLPPPAINSFIAGFEVDAAWPSRRMVVELDGHEFHRTRAAFERDRARDAALQVAGYRVLRITYRRLQREPEAVVGQLRALLASKPAA